MNRTTYGGNISQRLKVNVQLLNEELERNPAVACTEDITDELKWKGLTFSVLPEGRCRAVSVFSRGVGAGNCSIAGWGDFVELRGHMA